MDEFEYIPLVLIMKHYLKSDIGDIYRYNLYYPEDECGGSIHSLYKERCNKPKYLP
jgi:hypothetical protein